VKLHEQGDGAHVHLERPYRAITAPSACSSGGPSWAGSGRVAISAMYRSKPAGEIISRAAPVLTRVPEGVWHAPRLEDEISRPSDADLFPNLDADLALKHVGVFVLVLVCVSARRG
jgi:hypothetical protein